MEVIAEGLWNSTMCNILTTYHYGTTYGQVSVCLSLSQVSVLLKRLDGLSWFWHAGWPD